MKNTPQPQFNFKPYIPQVHPRQGDIDHFRAIPSLWNGVTYKAKK